MANLQRVKCEWNGLPGLPGLSVFYVDAAATGVTTALSSFFDGLKALWPQNLTVTVPSSGDIINDTTGDLIGSWTEGTTTTIASANPSASYAAGVGATIRWGTGGIVAGRRVVGRTFIAPLLGSAYDVNGTLTTPVVTALQSAATGLVGSADLKIWSRPFGGSATRPARLGSSHVVTSGTAIDRVASLRSRRT